MPDGVSANLRFCWLNQTNSGVLSVAIEILVDNSSCSGENKIVNLPAPEPTTTQPRRSNNDNLQRTATMATPANSRWVPVADGPHIKDAQLPPSPPFFEDH